MYIHEAEHPDNDCQKWYVMSAYRQEKKAEAAMELRSIRCFVPKRYVVKTIQGKKVRTLQPAIANLVFVFTSWNEIIALKQQLAYLQFQTYVIGKKRHVMIVPDQDMEQFIHVASQLEYDISYYRPEELPPAQGQKVRVVGGHFNGVEGRLIKIVGKRQKRLVLQLESLLAIAITVENSEYIELIKS